VLDCAIGCGTLADPTAMSPKAEAKFNRRVDTLANRIKAIFSSIHDSGASHLKRTEAKENLQAVHSRLIFSVRTKERPKRSWFQSDTREKDLMKRHFVIEP
jgi:hypothetical protein